MTHRRSPRPRRRVALLGSTIAVAAIVVALPAGGSAQSLHSELSHKRDELRQSRAAAVTLGNTISRYSSEIKQTSAEIARLRVREVEVRRQLVLNAAELRHATAHLAIVRSHLRAALAVLRQHLIAAYETGQPDAMTVILSAHGFNELDSRFEYLRSIQQQDNAIVDRVASLRNQVRNTVARLQAARDALAARREELARTQSALTSRQASLAAAQVHKRRALVAVQANGRQLQSDINSLQSRIAAQQAVTQGFGINSVGAIGTAFPAGAAPSGHAVSPFPASEPLTWGRTDQGVDGGTRPGSPLLAMGAGTVTIQHDPAGFGTSYPVLSTAFGDFYYGHCVPVVADGTHVSTGQQIAQAHYGTWGNSTTPGGFEIGTWPPGDMAAGGAIRTWLIALPRI